MSYILEALRKSQQERELGHVPTLETPAFPTLEASARPNRWIQLAVILAALAVAIALYSALRGGRGIPEPVADEAPEAQTAAPKSANVSAVAPEMLPTEPNPRQPAPAASGLRGSANDPPVPLPAGSAPPAAISAAPATPPQPSAQEIADAARPPTTPTRESESKVPPDLIADIEAFKREVSEERSGTPGAAKAEDKIPPQDLRLPKRVRDRLPEFVMSAHIFDEDPGKRFVLINGLKTREGEESREEIRVEQILPDGAVLSFDGNRFFQQR